MMATPRIWEVTLEPGGDARVRVDGLPHPGAKLKVGAFDFSLTTPHVALEGLPLGPTEFSVVIG